MAQLPFAVVGDENEITEFAIAKTLEQLFANTKVVGFIPFPIGSYTFRYET